MNIVIDINKHLDKLCNLYREEPPEANKDTENMYIVTPFRNKKKSSDLWSTHPSIENRIEALRNLK